MTERGEATPRWLAYHDQLAALAQRQLFFVGGAPRSGTTWLQQMLDQHPDVSCRGEGLFQEVLAKPLEKMMANRRNLLAGKNAAMFQHTGGYPLPEEDDTEILLGTAILLAFRQQCAGGECRAIGEKTPENVFLFPRLKRLFPGAKFIGIARDPRDSLTSAWHFWAKARHGDAAADVKAAFVRASLPAVEAGLRRFQTYAGEYAEDCHIITYEGLHRAPEQTLAALFRFLGVSDRPDITRACIESASFARMTGGRAPGDERDGSFLRKGVVGDWVFTLSPELSDLIAARLDWAFSWLGWAR
jgi:Sulfotransferase family